MPGSLARRPLSRHDWLVVFLTALAAVLAAVPGVHLLERWISHAPAMLVSHGLALVLLATAVGQWWVRRARPAGPPGQGAA